MLSIDEARDEVLAAIPEPLPSEELAVADALDRVLAEDVVAAHDTPRFANSAMDGFAVRAADGTGRRTVVGESRAGSPAAGAVDAGEAIRISTGAAMPEGADAVVPIERVAVDGDAIAITAGDVTTGANVRHAGEDLRAGALVLPSGTALGPFELGLAIGAGRGTVLVARRPRVAVVGTGDELVEPGGPLGPGQIHESNTVSLAALARREGADVVSVTRAPDDREAIASALGAALDAADVVIVSGGVSVGPHDHVKPVLEGLGVTERFWRVALRPGKPTWFGTRGRAGGEGAFAGSRPPVLVFGLPGNPVSSLVTFVLFARPALLALQGARAPGRRLAELAAPVRRLADRDEAVRTFLDEHGRVTTTGPQGSHVLSSMLGADVLAIVPRGEGELAAGTTVEVEPLR